MSTNLIPAGKQYEQQVAALTGAERAGMQAQLWELLARQCQRYTMGESSSLPEETVQELLRSISFCIGLRLKAGRTLLDTPLQQLFEGGQKQAWALAERGKAELEAVLHAALPIDNWSYQDTLRSLPEFFRLYDYRFFAHQIPCMIDYQLCVPLSEELEGVEFILAYLQRLHMENLFCRRFPLADVLRLLRAAFADYKGLLVNLMDGVFPNVAGRALLGKMPGGLGLDSRHIPALQALFHPWEDDAARQRMSGAVDRLCRELEFDSPSMVSYLQQAGGELLARIQITDADHYNRIFLAV